MTDRDFIQLYAEAPREARSYEARARMLRILDRTKSEHPGLMHVAIAFARCDLDLLNVAYMVAPKGQVTG